MLTAIIDVGSNSVRLLIAENHGGKVKSVRTELRSSRLGEGIGRQTVLGPNAIDRTLGALTDFKKIIDETGTQKVIVAATSAVRDAENQQEFLSLVREQLGWRIQVLSGEEEARLSYLGAVKGLALTGRPAVVDIGGGSTEFIWLMGDIPEFVSTKVGAVRMTEMGADGPAIRQRLDGVLASVKSAGFDQLVGVGGTVTTLAAIDQKLETYQPDLVHGYILERSRVQKILAVLDKMPLEERRTVAGLQAARADIIIAGIKILLTIMDGLGAEAIIVSETDIMYGLAYQSIYLFQGE